MAKLRIEIAGKNFFEGEYEFVEGGIDKKGSIGFHIDAHDQKYRGISIYLDFKDKAEYQKFLDDLNEQIKFKK